jgi:hypothetical protein
MHRWSDESNAVHSWVRFHYPIPLNDIPGSQFTRSREEDIDAACGQLAASE